jgi:hypothetical protein
MKTSVKITKKRHLTLPETVAELREVTRGQGIPFRDVDQFLAWCARKTTRRPPRFQVALRVTVVETQRSQRP